TGMVAGFVLRPEGHAGSAVLLAAGALLSAGGAYLFVYNIWRTVGTADVPVSLGTKAGTPGSRSAA
ncbi:MAG TPA: hypothetical protein VFU00_05060, partial [Gemmatimonadales bacterium]|nr:hypothetical protein [Gemmatimonadales bacterium]